MEDKMNSGIVLWGLVLNMASQSGGDLKSMSPQQIHAMPYSQIEATVMAMDKVACDGRSASYTQGVNDPNKLSPAEFCALQNYSKVRMDLAGSAINGTDWSYMRVLDVALKRIPNESALTVYQGTSRERLELSSKGQIVRLKEYTSANASREVAQRAVRDRLLVIRAISAKDVSHYSSRTATATSGDPEILLPRGTWVRFDDSEEVEMQVSTDAGPALRKVEIVYLTEVARP